MNQAERKFTVSVSSPSGCKRVLSIEIPKEELAAARAAVVIELRKDLRVPGFRKGKVPVKYVETNYADVIHGDAVRNLLPEVYEAALTQEGISPVSEPKFENVKAEPGADLSVDIEVEVRPEVEIKGYKNLAIKVAKKDIGDDAVTHALAHLQERLTQFELVDRAVEVGDTVMVDYAPMLDDGSLDEKQMAKGYPVDTGGDNVLPEFREGLIGLKVDEQKDLTVKYPEDFPEKALAGQSKTFGITVREVRAKKIPTLDDEFAQQMGEQFPDMESLRAQIKEDLLKDEEKRYVHEAEEKIIDGLIDKNQFDVPDAMVNNYLASVLEEDRKRRPKVPDEAEREREVREHFRDAAVRTVKKFIIMEAVREQESITSEDAEVEAKIIELAGDGERAGDILRYFQNPRHRRGIESELVDQKVLKFLRESADIKVA